MESVKQAPTRPAVSPRRKTFSTRKFRFWAQVFSSAVILWIGVQFVFFVSYLEGKGPEVGRPPGVEGFLPISGLLAVRDWFQSGQLNPIHPASAIILLVIVAVAFFFKKGFCSWVCPVGFISEMIASVGDRLTPRRLKLPRLLDWPFRSLKYLLLGFFVYVIYLSMTSTQVSEFIASPYNKVADIKMLKFFTEIDLFALTTIAILFVASIFLRGFWCRYLCPYGALLGLFSLAGPAKIKRDHDLCINCGKCARACPSFIKVDQIKQVVSDECTGCLDCVDVCPVAEALEPGLIGRRKKVPRRVWAYAIVVVFWGALLIFKLFGPWRNEITTEEYRYHIEQMDNGQYMHPGR